MPARTVKGPVFTLIFHGQQIVVKHVSAKGNRCRVIAPEGVRIESGLVTLGECPLADSSNEGVRIPAQAAPITSVSESLKRAGRCDKNICRNDKIS